MKKQSIVRKIAMGIICLSMVVTSLGMSGFTQVVYASGEFEGKQTKDFDFDGYWDYYINEKYNQAENIQNFFERIYNFLNDIIEKYQDMNVLIVAHGGVSIPVNCYFNQVIPKGSLVEVGLVLGNCQVASYDKKGN